MITTTGPSEQATWRPGPGPVLDSRPPRDSVSPRTGDLSAPLGGGPIGPVSASGNTANGDLIGNITRRPVNEPAFVTAAPRLTFEVDQAPPPPPPGRRWPWLVGAVLAVGVAGAGVALILKNVERAPTELDASFVVEETDAGPEPRPPTDGPVVVIIDHPSDAGIDGATTPGGCGCSAIAASDGTLTLLDTGWVSSMPLATPRSAALKSAMVA